MEPLKEMFNFNYIDELAVHVKNNYPLFDKKHFVQQFQHADFEALGLNDRMRLITQTLSSFLPDDYNKALEVLKKTIPLVKSGYTNVIFPEYVAMFGKNHFNVSMEALKFFTCFGTSEFAIREFLRADFHKTYNEMKKWAKHENLHIRRLASEGTRPRLPWSFKLDALITNPFITVDLLNTLRTDNELYVKKSVANHLNDIVKDHPDAFFSIIKSWDFSEPNTKWIIKHAGRNLIKQGDSTMLQILGVSPVVSVNGCELKLKNHRLGLGEYLEFTFEFNSEQSQEVIIDYAIYYLKSKGNYSRKVFKLKKLYVEGGKKHFISKKQLFKDFTTRKHYSGEHRLEIMMNGKMVSSSVFYII